MTTEPEDYRADVLSMAGWMYSAILTGRPNLLDKPAMNEKERHQIMRSCVADAEAMTELVYGRDDETATVPVPPVVVESGYAG